MKKKPKKMTPEERAEREAKHQDLTRRLEQKIEEYEKLIAERRAAGSS